MNENDSGSLGEPDLSDPFAALEPGDYGTDVCVRRDDIAAEFHNEDIELVRAYVDEHQDLRRVSDDSFVRNVVVDAPDDAAFIKRMLVDIPSDATEDTLMASALFHGAIPSSFVRLDGPSGKNVVTRIMTLDIETNKIDMLVSLGKAVQNQEGIDIAMIESALDNLAGLEDVEGIEQYIQQNLL
ncbi:hypothetical protein NDI56_16630 [Haloarcula sp. S1CR25-12]|uniref:Uncharacterized protein n=1 Tax=Haloarcula saliterrae TaxID=2950534 RepID=A0ABU2FFI7_9EURY|nr:hypothetical protein [Haloarcula sp. S1CR25-12]MDS0261027.1 hypothetical protein [Haloarcula sp. S1CR25-12]